MPAWLSATIVLFLLSILITIGGGLIYIISAIRDLDGQSPTPTPSNNYREMAVKAVAGDQTGLADEYAGGAFAAASEKILTDAGKKIKTRKQFSEFIRDLGSMLSANEPYRANLATIIQTAFSWIDKPAKFSDSDRVRAAGEMKKIALAFQEL